jgi:geranylgeranyl pyrophosphate synthase
MMTSSTAVDFKQRAAAAAEVVDRELTRLFSPAHPMEPLHGAALYAMGLDVDDRTVRGKRIRPVLAMLTAEDLGAAPHAALSFASAIEVLHNFALVHDDIEDGDTMRRGRPAVHVRHGLAHGINAGDYMLGRVFGIVTRDTALAPATRLALLELLDDTLEALFRGQAQDIAARGRHAFSMSEYEELVANKTGSYLAAPMIGGAIVAGADEKVLEALRHFGLAMGPLFQIRDDLIDLTAAKGRGASGSDIREGKRSYLVAAAAAAASAADCDRLFAILDTPREATTDGDVAWVIELFDRTGAIAAAESRCEELLREGLAAIAVLPPRLRATLEQFAEAMHRRTT